MVCATQAVPALGGQYLSVYDRDQNRRINNDVAMVEWRGSRARFDAGKRWFKLDPACQTA